MEKRPSLFQRLQYADTFVYGLWFRLDSLKSIDIVLSSVRHENAVIQLYQVHIPVAITYLSFLLLHEEGIPHSGAFAYMGFDILSISYNVVFPYATRSLGSIVRGGASVEEVTNNAGYLFLSILPMLVIYRKKPLLQFATFAFVMAFLIMGMKRGAIIIGAISAIYFMWRVVQSSRGNTRFLFIFLSVAICVGVVYFFIHEMATSDYMQQRLESTMEGNSSGRDDLYSFFWHYFTDEADVLHYLIGRGANGTLEIYNSYAHNDWLEIAVNQGVLGLVVYVFYFLGFYKTWKCATNTDAKTILALMLFIFFAKTLFSMSYGDMTFVATAPLGYALASINKSN